MHEQNDRDKNADDGRNRSQVGGDGSTVAGNSGNTANERKIITGNETGQTLAETS